LVRYRTIFLIPIFREKEALPPLWKLLTFNQNFGLNIQDFGTFSHGWSLCVEEHFYLLLPLVLLFLQSTNLFNKSYWILVALFIFGFIIRFYSWEILYFPNSSKDNEWLFWYKYIYYPTYNRLDGLLIGVSIASIYQFLPDFWDKISRFGNKFLIVSLLLLTSAYFLCYKERSFYASVLGFPLVDLGYGFMVLGAICPTSFLYKWNSKTTTFIATLSYGIYLIHKGIIHLTQQFLLTFNVDINSTITLVICIISCLIIAYILNKIIEKPFMQLRIKIQQIK
jgi:peptidoglycan/LPS O-acetylase OafA/YrhL